jgi:hypothetical protein
MPRPSIVGVKALTIRTPWRTYAEASALMRAIGVRAAVCNVAWRDTAARLIDDGSRVWLFALPEQNDGGTGDDRTPDEWLGTSARMSEVGKSIGAAGQVLNGEKGFGMMTRGERRVFVSTLGKKARDGESIVFATHGGLDGFAADLGDELGAAGVEAAPEAYHYQRSDADIVGRVRGVVTHWSPFGFAGICPYVGSLAKGRPFNDARAVRYWDTTDAELGGLIWCERAPRGVELQAMRRWALRAHGQAAMAA